MRFNLAMMARATVGEHGDGQATPPRLPLRPRVHRPPTAPAAPAAQHQPQAKTKEEYDAYNLAASKTDPAQMEAAADEFAQKFPTSELKEFLYVRAMNLYQQQNNSAKVIVDRPQGDRVESHESGSSGGSGFGFGHGHPGERP